MIEGTFHERFARHLAKMLEEPGRPRAVLRRSLAFPPGTWPDAFPYIEPFVANAEGWTRSAAYLVAGLFAIPGGDIGSGSFGAAAYKLRARTDSESVEARFLALLDADDEQLPHRLRQMVTLMASHEIAPDWAELFRDLTAWNSPSRWVQERWARDYYRQQASAEGNDTADTGSNNGDHAGDVGKESGEAPEES